MHVAESASPATHFSRLHSQPTGVVPVELAYHRITPAEGRIPPPFRGQQGRWRRRRPRDPRRHRLPEVGGLIDGGCGGASAPSEHACDSNENDPHAGCKLGASCVVVMCAQSSQCLSSLYRPGPYVWDWAWLPAERVAGVAAKLGVCPVGGGPIPLWLHTVTPPQRSHQGHETRGFQSAKTPEGLWCQTQACSMYQPSAGLRMWSSCPSTVGGLTLPRRPPTPSAGPPTPPQRAGAVHSGPVR